MEYQAANEPLDTFAHDPAQRVAADELDWRIEGAIAIQAAFERRVGSRHVVAVRQKSPFDPLDQVRAAGTNLKILPRRPESVPDGKTEIRFIPNKSGSQLRPSVTQKVSVKRGAGETSEAEEDPGAAHASGAPESGASPSEPKGETPSRDEP